MENYLLMMGDEKVIAVMLARLYFKSHCSQTYAIEREAFVSTTVFMGSKSSFCDRTMTDFYVFYIIISRNNMYYL